MGFAKAQPILRAIIPEGMCIQLTQKVKRKFSLGMVNKVERLIEFPIPDWSEIFADEYSLRGETRGLFFQFNVDQNGYGPYGFTTQNAEKIISAVFGEWYFLDKKNFSLKNGGLIRQNGLYIKGGIELEKELANYRGFVLKNELRRKKGLPISQSLSPPVIVESYQGNLIKAQVIKSLIDDGYSCLIEKFYAPQAGQSLVIFDEKSVHEMKYFSKEMGVGYCAASSIDDLRA